LSDADRKRIQANADFAKQKLSGGWYRSTDARLEPRGILSYDLSRLLAL
jgi:hypothetical protein